MENKDDLVTLITFENGKVKTDASGEVLFAARFWEWFAEKATRIDGDVIPHSSTAYRVSVMKEPIGVCGLITPWVPLTLCYWVLADGAISGWNFPAGMVTRKIGPALAAVCTVVLKSPGETPFSAKALAVLAQRADIFNLKVADSFLQMLHKFVKTRYCTKIRLAQTQVCPLLLNLSVTSRMARSRSASSKSTKAALPPNSRLSLLIVRLDCAMSNLPTLVEPVKEICRITLDVQSSWPICGVLVRHVTMLMTPGGPDMSPVLHMVHSSVPQQ